MGWFKDDVSERLNKLEAEVAWLRRDDLLKGLKKERECELPKEGSYTGEVVGMQTPRLRSTSTEANDWTITLQVQVDNLVSKAGSNVFTHLVMPKGAAMALHALRHSVIGKRVKIKAKHRAVPNGIYDPCSSSSTQIIVGWTIEEWEDNCVKSC